MTYYNLNTKEDDFEQNSIKSLKGWCRRYRKEKKQLKARIKEFEKKLNEWQSLYTEINEMLHEETVKTENLEKFIDHLKADPVIGSSVKRIEKQMEE